MTYVCNKFMELGVGGASVLTGTGGFGVGEGNCLTSDGSVKFKATLPSSCMCDAFSPIITHLTVRLAQVPMSHLLAERRTTCRRSWRVCPDEDARVFDLMPAPANSALHRSIRELTRVRADLAALEAEPGADDVELRIEVELVSAQGWIRRVCEAAGALSIADPAFSPKK